VIALDANVLRGLSFPRDVALSMLEALARDKSHRLVLPETVLNEYLSHRKSEYETALEEADRAAAVMLGGPAFPGREHWQQPPHPPVEQLVAAVEDQLRGRFDILPLAGEQAIEALRREAFRIAPARTTEPPGGARDASIWLSLVDWCGRNPDEEVYLVTHDNGLLSRALDAEEPPNLHRVKGIHEALATLATPIDHPADLLPLLLTEEVVSTAVSEAVAHTGPFRALMSTVPNMTDTMLGWWSPEIVKLVRIDKEKDRRHRAYEINGRKWVTTRATWRVVLTVNAYPGQRRWTFTYEVETTIVVRLDATGAVDYATVSFTGNPRVLDVAE
jgi:hypothetical protein